MWSAHLDRDASSLDQAYALRPVQTPGRSWSEYARFVNDALSVEVATLARRVRGCRVVQINATPAGGGVAEMLFSLVPVLRSLGIDAHWYTLPPNDAFFEVTKHLHNALQGAVEPLESREWSIYFDTLERVAGTMGRLSADVWVVHDPQPLPLAALTPLHCQTLWRCHIDCSSPNPSVPPVLLPWVLPYDRAIFSRPEYVLDGLSARQTALEYPAIDPLTPKNRRMRLSTARTILARLGVDPARPLVTQVSRFDPWKNPWQALDAYRIAKRRAPGLQLALVGVFSAKDDPEGPRIYESVRDYARGDGDVHFFTDPNQVGDREINAFQTASDVILQRSRREGFGLVVTEAMWKARPVIATPVGGIPAQIEGGRSGVLVSSAEECADWMVRLLQDAALSAWMGQAARARVRTNFLLPRLVRDELALYAGNVSALSVEPSAVRVAELPPAA
jgi:trehalose synthase